MAIDALQVTNSHRLGSRLDCRSALPVGLLCPAMNWEYMVVDTNIGFTEDLQLKLTALGSLGWEAVGYTCIIQMGPNMASVLLKREAAMLAPPDDLTAGWRTDPTQRFQQRHWDGLRWTQHVSTGGVTDTDFPNVR
jgi:uncharacterized protein DUF2510